MELELEPGFYVVELSYQWTSAFTVGIVFSILSIIALALYGFKNWR